VRLQAARWVWAPTLAFAVTRLAVALAAYLGATLLADGPNIYHIFGTDNLLLDVFASRWDTGFYLSIADEGYKNDAVPFPSTAFWPLLPLLMRALGWLLGSTAVAGVLIANLALLGAMMLLYRLADEEWGAEVATRSVWYMLIYPASFFGSAIYTESLFLLCAIGALYLARRGAWESAGLLGAAGALARLVGVIMAPVLLAEWWRQRRAGGRPSPVAILAVTMVPLGTLAYMLYLYLSFGDALAFVHASAAWEREPQSPLMLVAELVATPEGGWPQALLAGRFRVSDWIDLSAVVFFLVMGAVLLREGRWPEGLLVTLGVLLPLSSGLLMSQRRYMWVLFPAFILLARWGGRAWVDRLVTAVSLTLLALFTALFANGYWVG
jgi:hypothetical protein